MAFLGLTLFSQLGCFSMESMHKITVMHEYHFTSNGSIYFACIMSHSMNYLPINNLHPNRKEFHDLQEFFSGMRYKLQTKVNIVLKACPHEFELGTECKKNSGNAYCIRIKRVHTHYRVMRIIKTHGSVSCDPRSWRATPVSILTGRTKISFSHLCISVITYLIGTKFVTQLPASQGSIHSKFEGNRSIHFRDTSYQNFVVFSSSFRTLTKIAIKRKCVLRSP